MCIDSHFRETQMIALYNPTPQPVPRIWRMELQAILRFLGKMAGKGIMVRCRVARKKTHLFPRGVGQVGVIGCRKMAAVPINRRFDWAVNVSRV